MTARDWETIAAQLLGAVHFLHAVGVVHRDVKPENVMLKRAWVGDAAPRVALVDFGSAAFARGAGKENALRGFAGTKFFGAPECFRGVGAHGAKSDVWSLAVTLLALLVGTPPTRDVDSAWRALQDGSIPASMRPGDDTPTRLLELVRFMLVADPRARPSASEARGRTRPRRRRRRRDGRGVSRDGGRARARYRRSAAFELSVLLDARRAKKLLAESFAENPRDATKTSPREGIRRDARGGASNRRRRGRRHATRTPRRTGGGGGVRGFDRRVWIRHDPPSRARTRAEREHERERVSPPGSRRRSRWRRDAWRTSRSYTRGTVACTETVAGGASTRDGALREEEQRARRRLNAGDSVHAGMLMAMLTHVSVARRSPPPSAGRRRAGLGRIPSRIRRRRGARLEGMGLAREGARDAPRRR